MKQSVGILGASSFVAEAVITRLQNRYDVVRLSRRGDDPAGGAKPNQVPLWVSAIPMASLPDCFDQLVASGARRIVALSSTSVFTKKDSSNAAERDAIARMLASEQHLSDWAGRCGIDWIVLRPTLIYGHGRDRNVSEIARFIRRFGFFPVFGAAQGLRQPVHCEDVADACLRVLEAKHLAGRGYIVSGGETVSYREMVLRIFQALGRRPLFLRVPLWSFRLGVATIRMLPRFHDWSTAMAERMNHDLVFPHDEAVRDFGFSPRPFRLQPADVPR